MKGNWLLLPFCTVLTSAVLAEDVPAEQKPIFVGKKEEKDPIIITRTLLPIDRKPVNEGGGGSILIDGASPRFASLERFNLYVSEARTEKLIGWIDISTIFGIWKADDAFTVFDARKVEKSIVIVYRWHKVTEVLVCGIPDRPTNLRLSAKPIFLTRDTDLTSRRTLGAVIAVGTNHELYINVREKQDGVESGSRFIMRESDSVYDVIRVTVALPRPSTNPTTKGTTQ